MLSEHSSRSSRPRFSGVSRHRLQVPGAAGCMLCNTMSYSAVGMCVTGRIITPRLAVYRSTLRALLRIHRNAKKSTNMHASCPSISENNAVWCFKKYKRNIWFEFLNLWKQIAGKCGILVDIPRTWRTAQHIVWIACRLSKLRLVIRHQISLWNQSLNSSISKSLLNKHCSIRPSTACWQSFDIARKDIEKFNSQFHFIFSLNKLLAFTLESAVFDSFTLW